jgi:hypothetical protein
VPVADYSEATYTTCVGCSQYTVYKNVNPSFTGNQWAIFNPNGSIRETYPTQPYYGGCNYTANWVNNGSPYCDGSNNYIQKQTDNTLCSSTYNQDRYVNIGSCAPVYNQYVSETCVGCNQYSVYRNKPYFESLA